MKIKGDIYHKKGELSMQFVIIAALLLIVFVVMLMIITGNLSSLSQGFFQLGSGAQDKAQGNNCESWFGERKCASSVSDTVLSDKYNWIEVTQIPDGGWKDCAEGKKCFERGDPKDASQ
ncbi:hypothetical protein K9M79_02760 [Candidatus Woesearchaeota archaeon]|nr:hypothetical protein [Candidatus Woesearchaeota archaeon]